jgi:hypothetical protein
MTALACVSKGVVKSDLGKSCVEIMPQRRGFEAVLKLEHSGKVRDVLHQYLARWASFEGLDPRTAQLIDEDRRALNFFVGAQSNDPVGRTLIGLKLVPAGVVIDGSVYVEKGREYQLLPNSTIALLAAELTVRLKNSREFAGDLGAVAFQLGDWMRSQGGGHTG